MRNRMLACVALAASVALVAGCATPRPLPPGPDEAEVREILDRQNSDWWDLMFPGQPQPSIEVIEVIPEDEWTPAMVGCMTAAGIEGVSATEDGLLFEPPPGTQRAMNRAYFECFLQYPVEVVDGAAMIGEAQVSWLYDYFDRRLAPCLRLLGYRVEPSPPREQFLVDFYNYNAWTPYAAIAQADTDWDLLDARCPPPPALFEFLHP